MSEARVVRFRTEDGDEVARALRAGIAQADTVRELNKARSRCAVLEQENENLRGRLRIAEEDRRKHARQIVKANARTSEARAQLIETKGERALKSIIMFGAGMAATMLATWIAFRAVV